MEFVYLMVNGLNWENMIILLTKEEAIESSIKYPNRRVEIFIKSDLGYEPTYNFYKNGKEFISID